MERTDYDLLSIDEVARTIGQSVKTLRRMIRDGEFPSGFLAPRKTRWRWAAVRDWVIRHELAAEQNRDKPAQSGTNAPTGAEGTGKRKTAG